MLKPANCVVLLLLLFCIACNQNGKSEGEEKAFWHSKVIDSSYRLLYNDKDTARALAHYESVLAESNNVTLYPKAAKLALLANYYYFFTTDDGSTAKVLDSAISLFNTDELQNRYPRIYVHLLLFGGQIAYRVKEYSKANEYYFKAKRLGDAHLSPCERTPFNYSIAMVLFRQQNFNQSLNYFKQAYDLQNSCAPQTTAVVLQQQEIQSNIGLCLVKLKKYDSAMVHFNKALQIADAYKDSLGPVTIDKIYGVVYGNKAKVALAKNQLELAEKLLLKSIALNDRKGYEMENAAGVKLQLAEIYNRVENFAGMFDILNSMSSYVEKENSLRALEWKRLMASYYEQQSRPDSAIHYLKSYFILGDSIAAQQERLTAADVNRQLRDKEQKLEISMLKKSKEVALISLYAIIVFSLMTLVIIYLFYQNYRRSKKSLVLSLELNEEIQQQKIAREEEAKKQHRLITEAVIKAQENERSLIGLELHDNINQVLTTVKLHNEMVLEGVIKPTDVLPSSIKYLQGCIAEIRSLSKRLSAPTLGKISLEESVRDLLDSVKLGRQVKIIRQISGFKNQVLKQELHVGVYRILQEQLNNVIKHAEASEVLVLLEYKNDQVRLLVRDNGKGFCVQSSNDGIGLMNMQTRAENLNGKLDIISKPGEGCCVEVILPCSN